MEMQLKKSMKQEFNFIASIFLICCLIRQWIIGVNIIARRTPFLYYFWWHHWQGSFQMAEEPMLNVLCSLLHETNTKSFRITKLRSRVFHPGQSPNRKWDSFMGQILSFYCRNWVHVYSSIISSEEVNRINTMYSKGNATQQAISQRIIPDLTLFLGCYGTPLKKFNQDSNAHIFAVSI